MIPDQPTLKIARVAQLLDCSTKTVNRMIDRGVLQAIEYPTGAGDSTERRVVGSSLDAAVQPVEPRESRSRPQVPRLPVASRKAPARGSREALRDIERRRSA